MAVGECWIPEKEKQILELTQLWNTSGLRKTCEERSGCSGKGGGSVYETDENPQSVRKDCASSLNGGDGMNLCQRSGSQEDALIGFWWDFLSGRME